MKQHVSSMLAKLDLNNRTQIALPHDAKLDNVTVGRRGVGRPTFVSFG